MALSPEQLALLTPLSEIEKAQLVETCKEVLTPTGVLLFRRALAELDRLKQRIA